MQDNVGLDGEEIRKVQGGDYGITMDGRLWRYPRRNKKTGGWVQGTGTPKRYFIFNDEPMLLASRLVAEAWLPKPEGYEYVRFRDNDPTNCHLANLYWSKSSGGGRRGRKILCIETGEEFASIKEAALALGMTASHISAQLAAKIPQAKGKRFKYVEQPWKNPLARD